MIRMSSIVVLGSLLFLSIAQADTTTTIKSTTLPQPTTVQSTTTTRTPEGNVIVEKREIVTAVPAAKETISIPEGYVSCFTVAAGWYQDVWVPAHKVCKYANSPGRVAWIQGYWACTKYRLEDGACTSWDWRPPRWSSKLENY